MTSRERGDTPPAPLAPGTVFRHGWGCMKPRPWMVLWVEDGHGSWDQQVCVVAITSQGDYTGAIATGHPKFGHCGAWVMIQPLRILAGATQIGYIDKPARDRIAKALSRNLALMED